MAKRLAPAEALQKISAWLAEIYGTRLLSLLVYGSAAGGHRHTRRSDINLLAVFDRIDVETLDKGADAARWWHEQGNPGVVMLSRDEMEDAAQIFPIEFLDIQANHSLLRGEDELMQAKPQPELHRRQVEHELRAKLLRLRGAYMRHGRDARRLESLLLDSASTFLTLFRHALVAEGQALIWPKDELVAVAAARFGFAPEPWHAILRARQQNGRLEGGKLAPLQRLFAQNLAAIQAVERAMEKPSAEIT